MELDPDFQNFRILSDAETPPAFAGFFGDRESLIILPNKNTVQEKYLPAADLLATDYGLRTMTDAEDRQEGLHKRNTLFSSSVAPRRTGFTGSPASTSRGKPA